MTAGRWPELANCVGTYVDEFYPSGPGAGGTFVRLTVRDLCTDCPVRDACRVASVGERWGWWGGLSQVDREEMRAAIGYEMPDLDSDVANKFHRAADRGYATDDMLGALARIIGERRAAIVMGWKSSRGT